jgi:hypothetical protein
MMAVGPLLRGLARLGPALARAAKAIYRAAKSPAIRKAAVKAATKSRQFFSKTKGVVKQLCKKGADKVGELWRRMTGRMNIKDLLNKSKPGKFSKSHQYSRPGGFNQANKDFDKLTKGLPVKNHGGGIRSATLRDGSKISVRPSSSGGSPSIQINPPKGRVVKVRY